MAKKIMYTLYMEESCEMFDISNTDDGSDYLGASEEGAKNPPIKMTVLECSEDFSKICGVESVSDDLVEREDDPSLEEECINALLDKPSDWRLTGVNCGIGSIHLTLTKADSKQSFVDIGIRFSEWVISLAFDVARYNAPAEHYEIEQSSHRGDDEEPRTSTKIVEYRNGCKFRTYKFDNVSHEIKGIGYPCHIEEY